MTETLRTRLSAMTEKLSSLEKAVAEEALRKRAIEEQRIQHIAARVTGLEADLTEEIKGRVETSRDLQQLGQSMLEQAAASIQDTLSRAMDSHAVSLEELVARCEEFETTLTEREHGPHKSGVSFAQVDEGLQNLKEETAKLREEFETVLLPDVDDSLKRSVRELRDMRRRLNSALEQDTSRFQEALAEIREKCAQTNQEANESNTTYKLYIPQEMNAFKEAIQKEASMREETDDAMVKALNEYNLALQKGFSTIMRG